MKIILTTSLSGPNGAHAPGDEIERDKDEALRLIEAGYAVPVAEDKIERAVKPAAKVEKRG